GSSRARLDERARNVADDFIDASGALSPEIEKTSSAFCIGLLAGTFDEGGAFDPSDGEARIELTRGDATTRTALQRMLLRLGIVSRIEHGQLAIAGPSALRFAGVVIAPSLKAGLGDAAKRTRLLATIGHAGTERFCAEIASVEPDGEAAVFDAQI